MSHHMRPQTGMHPAPVPYNQHRMLLMTYLPINQMMAPKNRILLALNSNLPNEQNWAVMTLTRISYHMDDFLLGSIPGITEALLKLANGKNHHLQATPITPLQSPPRQQRKKRPFQETPQEEMDTILQIMVLFTNLALQEGNLSLLLRYPQFLELVLKSLHSPSPELVHLSLNLLVTLSARYGLRSTQPPGSDTLFATLLYLVTTPDSSLIRLGLQALIRVSSIESNVPLLFQQGNIPGAPPQVIRAVIRLLFTKNEILINEAIEWLYVVSGHTRAALELVRIAGPGLVLTLTKLLYWETTGPPPSEQTTAQWLKLAYVAGKAPPIPFTDIYNKYYEEYHRPLLEHEFLGVVLRIYPDTRLMYDGESFIARIHGLIPLGSESTEDAKKEGRVQSEMEIDASSTPVYTQLTPEMEKVIDLKQDIQEDQPISGTEEQPAQSSGDLPTSSSDGNVAQGSSTPPKLHQTVVPSDVSRILASKSGVSGSPAPLTPNASQPPAHHDGTTRPRTSTSSLARPTPSSGPTSQQEAVGIPLTACLVLRNLVRLDKDYIRSVESELVELMCSTRSIARFVGWILKEAA